MNNLHDAVLEQLGFYADTAEDTLSDIANHGIDGGFNGFTYYSDTLDFYDKHRELIIERLKEDAEGQGYDSLYSLVKTFKCASDSTEEEIVRTLYADPDQSVANCLAWYAAECIARDAED